MGTDELKASSGADYHIDATHYQVNETKGKFILYASIYENKVLKHSKVQHTHLEVV